jgi:hypothetical protein
MSIDDSRPVNLKVCILAENCFFKLYLNSVTEKLIVCADWRSLEIWLAVCGPRIIFCDSCLIQTDINNDWHIVCGLLLFLYHKYIMSTFHNFSKSPY